MVLTDREIQVAIRQKQLLIDPEPPEGHYSSTSIDLTLSTKLRIWEVAEQEGVEPLTLSPGAKGYKHDPIANKHTRLVEMTEAGHVVKPGEFLLAWTEESVCLPTHSRLAARVEGKSSLARCAVSIHVTAPTIHAGFDGQIQLEICNVGPLHVRLLPKMRICQLIFEQTLGTPVKGYQGQFLGDKAH